MKILRILSFKKDSILSLFNMNIMLDCLVKKLNVSDKYFCKSTVIICNQNFIHQQQQQQNNFYL